MNTTLKDNFAKLGKSQFIALVFALAAFVILPNLTSANESDFDYSSQSLRVGVWVENLDEGDVLDRGEEIAVGFQTNEDAYAVVYRINTEGLVTVLWPRSRMDDGFVFGGHEYLMPITGGPRLVASSQTGEGFVEAVVSRYPFDLRDLPLDFHHEFVAEKHEFFVAGDPFLAINEVNFAVTGLEDSGDFVVTNYLSYYVHEQVEHPRYLCDQCHFDDDVAFNPYNDQCTIEITVDYGWGNDWYQDLGYYPIYHNPVYVYYDPWTWRPWVNFWYDPFYSCASRPGYHYNHTSYVWCDSPYYHYDGVRRKTGRGIYHRPDNGGPEHTGRRKTSDYTRVSGQIAQRGPTDNERETMRQKRRATPDISHGVRGDQSVRTPGSPVVVRGEKPMSRTRPSIATTTDRGSRGGLQIRKATKPGRGSLSGSTNPRTPRQVNTTPVRGGSSGGTSVVGSGRLQPVNGSGVGVGGNTTTVRGSSRPTANRPSSVKPARSKTDDGRIKPVEPRKKGTRIWNSGSSNQSGDRKVRTPARSSSGRSGSSSTVQPRSSKPSKRSSSTVKPKTSNRGSSGSSTVRSGSSSSSKGKNTGSSKSSSGKSSSKSSSKSSKSNSGRDGGSSRSKR